MPNQTATARKSTQKRIKNTPSKKQASQPLSVNLLIQRAQVAPQSLTPDQVLQLQRTVGNRAVRTLLTQRKPQQIKPLPLSQQGNKPTHQTVQRKTKQVDLVGEFVLAGYKQDKPMIKRNLASAVAKFRTAINQALPTKRHLDWAELRDAGRDAFSYRNTAMWLWSKVRHTGGIIGLVNKHNEKWSVANTGGLLADLGLALKRLELRGGLSFDEIVSQNLQIGSDHVRKRRDEDTGELLATRSDWKDDIAGRGTVGSKGPSSTTGQLLHVISSIGGFTDMEVESMMIALIKFWQKSSKRLTGSYHTPVEVWAPYIGYLEAKKDQPNKEGNGTLRISALEDYRQQQQQQRRAQQRDNQPRVQVQELGREEVTQTDHDITQYQNLPQGPLLGRRVTYNNGKTVMASKNEDEPRNIEVKFVTNPSEDETEIPLTMYQIFCDDSLRRKGIAQVRPAGYGMRSYHIALGDLFHLDTGAVKRD